MKVLLINKNADARFMGYDKQYRLFDGWKSALAVAKEIGWEDPFGMGINQKRGIGNIYKCGDIDLMLIALEVE